MRRRTFLLAAPALAIAVKGQRLNAAAANDDVPGPRKKNDPQYHGQVATNSTFHLTFFMAFTKAMSRSHHIARDDISNPILTFGNFYCGSNEVAGSASATSITASIEFPAGTFTRIAFSRSNTGVIRSGDYVTTDPCPVSIPNGASFWVRSYQVNSGGLCWNSNPNDMVHGEALNLGASDVIDQTMGGTVYNIPGPAGFGCIRPHSIVALTRRPSIMMIGDSRLGGAADSFSDGSADIGEVARSLGPHFGYVNAGINSDSAGVFINDLNAHVNRVAIGQCCSHVISQYGVNDLIARFNNTAAQLEANQQTLAGYFPGKPFFLCTVAPVTDSTDEWKTIGNQTIKPGEMQRALYNSRLRAGSLGKWCSGYFDIAKVVEAPRNAGDWCVNGTSKYITSDGIHETQAANLLIAQSGCISPSVLHR